MGRPPKTRSVAHVPKAVYWKPTGVPLRDLEEVHVGLDELEAFRLADLEGLSQEGVGEAMGVSRATAGRVLATARRKVAEALVEGKALLLDGGPTRFEDEGGRGLRGGHGHGGGRGGRRRGRGRGGRGGSR